MSILTSFLVFVLISIFASVCVCSRQTQYTNTRIQVRHNIYSSPTSSTDLISTQIRYENGRLEWQHSCANENRMYNRTSMPNFYPHLDTTDGTLSWRRWDDNSNNTTIDATTTIRITTTTTTNMVTPLNLPPGPHLRRYYRIDCTGIKNQSCRNQKKQKQKKKEKTKNNQCQYEDRRPWTRLQRPPRTEQTRRQDRSRRCKKKRESKRNR
jgi:hypothetical protein